MASKKLGSTIRQGRKGSWTSAQLFSTLPILPSELMPMSFICSFCLEFRYAFHKYADGRINSLGISYDYDSVMHYDSRAFSMNGRTTIARKNGDTRLGNTRGLSRRDIEQAKLLYCRTKSTDEPPKRTHGLFTDQNIWSNPGPHLVQWSTKNNPRFVGINK